MKLRKIVSILASMTIAASTLVALSTASFAETKQLSYIVDCTPVDFTSEAYSSYKEDYDWSEHGDYTTYSVKISLKGLAMTTTVSGKSKLLSGDSITVGEIGANVSAEGQNYGDDYQIGLIDALGDAKTNINATYIGASYNSSTPLYPPAKTAMTVTAEDEIPGIFEFLITVDNTKPITLEFLTEKNTIATTEFSDNTPVANTTVGYYAAATPATLVIPPVSSDPDPDPTPAGKGTQITEVVDGEAGYYLSNVPLSGLSQSTMFVIKYTGSDTVLNENGTKTEKTIQRNLGQILGGEFAVGTGVTGNLHFGIKLPTEKASEAVNFSVVTE